MTKTILITGATDGIGYATAKQLAADGHTLLLHGRNADKLSQVLQTLSALPGAGPIKTYRADLSDIAEVEALASNISDETSKLDVLINNAGVFTTPHPRTKDGYDVRFIVNTVSPYLLTHRLLPLLGDNGRVVNLSSAAQAPVDLSALSGIRHLSDGEAYAQSKLGITMWSADLARELGPEGVAIIAVNPASFLGSKMVKEAYGRAGHDLSIGADILVRAALSAEFSDATGLYYDNDHRTFAQPHADALDAHKCAQLVAAIEDIIAKLASF